MTSVACSPNRATRSRTNTTRSARHPPQDATMVSLRLDVCTPSGLLRALKGGLSRIGRRPDHGQSRR